MNEEGGVHREQCLAHNILNQRVATTQTGRRLRTEATSLAQRAQVHTGKNAIFTLEGMRAALAKSWGKAGSRDSYLLRYHVLAEQVFAFQLKHYIKCEQLSLRDLVIDV